jgi:hypothetical protein
MAQFWTVPSAIRRSSYSRQPLDGYVTFLSTTMATLTAGGGTCGSAPERKQAKTNAIAASRAI